MRLTEKQIAALREIEGGVVMMHNCGHAAWRIMSVAQPSVVGRVVSLGLVEWASEPDRKVAILTQRGRDALRAIKQ